MARNPGALSRSSKEKLAKLATGVVAVVLISMASGLLHLYYSLYVALTTPSNTGAVDSMEGFGILILIIYSIAGTVAYVIIGLGGIWLIGKLRDYYTSMEKQRSYIPDEPELPEISTEFNKEAEEATVHIKQSGTADVLKICVDGEVRGTINNPNRGDSVTVTKRRDETLEIKKRSSRYRTTRETE